MDCGSNCVSCLKSSYYGNTMKREDHHYKQTSLILPSIPPFSPTGSSWFSQSRLAPPGLDGQFYPTVKKEALPYNFPPLFGLNMKFGEGEALNFQRTKIDFSIESLTSDLRSSKDTIVGKSPESSRGKQCSVLKNRGRPSADSINLLRQSSLQSPHHYQCLECRRSFPRKKSLDTHRLTHSNVKPYVCDFPSCAKKFKQSGQLKTHLRLHTGEKPFKCTFPLCPVSFTHANRKCSHHPEYPLRRNSSEALTSMVIERVMHIHRDENVDQEKVRLWLKKQYSDRSKNDFNCSDVTKSVSRNSDNILKSIENIQYSKNVYESSKMEEDSKRLLTAVALVELQEMKTKTKENFQSMLSVI